MDSSNNNSLTLSDYLDFDSSSIDNSFDISDLEPMNLDEINIGIGAEELDWNILLFHLTMGQEIDMYSVDVLKHDTLNENCVTNQEIDMNFFK